MLARLVVHLQSNYSHLTSGLRVAQNSVANTARSIRASMSGAVGAIAGVASVGAAVAAVTSQMQALDKVADLGNQTGFGAATIFGLGHAAQMSGADVETLQKALTKFSSVMGNAQAGAGPAIEAFDRLGLSYDQIAALSPDEQILKISEAMRSLPNEAARNAVAMQLFGKSGAALSVMLNEGEAGLRSFIDQAKRMGLGFDQEELNRVAEANDAIDKIKTQLAAIVGIVAVGIAPAITAATSYVQDFANSFGGVRGAVSEVGAWWTWLQNGIARGITVAMAVAGFAMDNWRDIADLAISSVMLGFVQLGNQIVYVFGTVAPAILNWFADNWKDIFFTLFDLATTVFINLGVNIRNAMSAIWDYIASGGTKQLEFAWTPLTEGFVNSIKELPDIPERVIGPLEAEMAKRVEELGASVGGGLGQAISDNLAALEKVQAGLPQNTPPEAPVSLGAGSDGMQGGQSAGTDKKIGALAKGSVEAQSAIYAAMREKEAAIKVAQKNLAVAQAQLAETKKLNARLSSGGSLMIVEDLA